MTRIPESAKRLAALLVGLRLKRRKLRNDDPKRRRAALNAKDRAEVLAKTARRCHICGGRINGAWQADHVLAHSCGGAHAADNYLPAHALCNNYRWDYSSEFQWILKIGVWARKQIEDEAPLGREMAERFVAYEQHREKRQG